MSQEKKHILIFLYYSLRDPLCEGLILSHIKAINKSSIKFHLITFEQEKFHITDQEREDLQQNLNENFNIYWYPMKYRSGRFFLIKKMISVLAGLRMAWNLNRKNGVDMICAMGTPAGTFGYIASRLIGKPLCQLTYEPHSLIMMQSGKMNPNSIRFKVARYFEIKIGLNSEYVVCTTRHMLEDLRKAGARGKLLRLPSSVDESVHRFDSDSRNTIRAKLGIESSSSVIIYPGKFGGMYRQKETIQLITNWLELMPKSHAVIITDHSLEIVQNWMKECNADITRIHLMRTVPLAELHQYISAADIGLVAYENFDSRKYCSPVKTGEFLMCGIPYIVQSGTSEDDEIAIQENVGVVIDTFDHDGLQHAMPDILELLEEEKNTLRKRCRETGIKYRGKKNAVEMMQKIFEGQFEL